MCRALPAIPLSTLVAQKQSVGRLSDLPKPREQAPVPLLRRGRLHTTKQYGRRLTGAAKIARCDNGQLQFLPASTVAAGYSQSAVR